MTLKEYLRQPNPVLDKLVENAEEQRVADEECAYENYQGGNHYD